MKEVIYELIPVFGGLIAGFIAGVVVCDNTPFWQGFKEGITFKPIIDWFRRNK